MDAPRSSCSASSWPLTRTRPAARTGAPSDPPPPATSPPWPPSATNSPTSSTWPPHAEDPGAGQNRLARPLSVAAAGGAAPSWSVFVARSYEGADDQQHTHDEACPGYHSPERHPQHKPHDPRPSLTFPATGQAHDPGSQTTSRSRKIPAFRAGRASSVIT